MTGAIIVALLWATVEMVRRKLRNRNELPWISRDGEPFPKRRWWE